MVVHVNLELYRVFVATAKAGSISAAARQLYISQPAVSQAIRQLENKLGGALFHRTPHGIVLTNEGEVMLRYVEQAMQLIETAQQKFEEMERLETGELRIGASDTLCRCFLLPYLELFHMQYPKISLHITNRTTPETMQLLKSGGCDIAFVNLPIIDERLSVAPIYTIHDCFVASGGNFASLNKESVPLEELAQQPLLMLETASNSRRYLDAYALRHGVVLEPQIELGSNDLLLEFARIGLGVASAIREFAQTHLQSGDLFEVPVKPAPAPRSIGMASLVGVPFSFPAARFAELLQEKVEILCDKPKKEKGAS